MSQLHDLIASNGRTLRYALGAVLLVAGVMILAAKAWSGLHG